jgi:hypothetical protein
MASDGFCIRQPLETAPQYAALGFVVLPECPPDCPTCEPRNKGKVPWDPAAGRHLVGWQRRERPTGPDLDLWLDADARRNAAGQAPLNLGCRCGPGCLGEDGLVGADADGPRGVAELDLHLGLAPGVLEAALTEYRESGIFRPSLGTAAYLTPSGGLRALWRVPAGRTLRTVGKDAGHDGLRLAWAGGQIVLPPSVRPEGDYRWLPGHSPWQTEIAVAPASVLATMSGKPGHANAPISVTVLPVPTYPAATGDRGPNRDGGLVDAVWLPYDLPLLRDGAPKGGRSEAVRRLELQMLAAGWTVEQVVAALAGQPWIQAMRPNIVGWLTADVLRAAAWRAEQDTATAGEAVSLWTPRGYRGSRIGATSGSPARENAEPGVHADGAAGGSEVGGSSANSDDRAHAAGGAGSPPPLGDAGSPGAAEWDRYNRRDHGTRLRCYDRDRDEAVRRGVQTIRDFVAGLTHPDKAQQRLLQHCERLLESFDRCRTKAWGHPHDLREQERRAAAGRAWLWSDQPCDGRGHEDCAPFHAARELREKWESALSEVYGYSPVAVLALSAPGWGLEQTHKAASALFGAAKVRHALGLCAGFLTFEPSAAPGYSFNLVVPAHRADELRLLLVKEWRQRVPCGWVRVLNDLPHRCTALEALVELRVRSEQAILLALGRSEVNRERAITLYTIEMGAFSGSDVGGQKHRLVLAPGMRKLAKDIREGRLRLAAAVGDGTEGADRAASPGAQGEAGTAPAIEGMGAAGGIPSNNGIEAGSPSAASAPEVSAGAEQGSSGTSSPPDDEGWVPCPWDPSLEMRPSRDPHTPRALPWWKLQKMTERGELVPIVHNGRVIGYRELPGRGDRRA